MKKFSIKNIDVAVVSLILLSVLLVIFKDIVFSDYVFVKRDISRYYYPIRKLCADMFRDGTLPLWNPFLFCGMPLHASIQNSVFYPPSLIYYLMDTARGFGLFIILHILLCGVFTYIFMRYWKVSRQGSFLAALTFTFSGYIMSAVSLTISLNSVCWFPLVLFLFFKALKLRRYSFSVFCGAVLTLMFLAGDPSILLATVSILFLTSCLLFFEGIVRDKKAHLFIIGNFLSISLTFFLLSMFQILPAIEYYMMTVRAAMGWKEAAAWSVPYSDFFSLIIPYFNDLSCYYQDYWVRQSWLDNYYVGITTIMLSVFALRLGMRTRLVQFLSLIALIFIFVCLGKYFYLYHFLYKFIPVFRIVRYPVRFFFVFTFSICALAGIGYDYLRKLEISKRPKRMGRGFLILAVFSSFVVLIITLYSEQIATFIMQKVVVVYEKNKEFNIWQFPSLIYADMFNLRRTLLYVGSFGLFIFFWSNSKSKKIIPLVIFFIVGSDILLTNTGYEPTSRVEYFKRPTKNIEHAMKDKSLFRILASPYSVDRFTKLYEKSYRKGIESSKDRFMTNRMMEFGLYDMWGYDSTALKRNLDIAKRVYQSKVPTDTKLTNLLNVKYVSSHKNMRAPGYKKASETEHATIYLNPKVIPRAFLVRKALVMNDDEAILDYMDSDKFDPENEIILEEVVELPGKLAQRTFSGRRDSVSILNYKPNMVEIVLYCKAPAYLLLSDTFYPGWKAYVDGRQERIYRADYFLRAIRMPEGEHLVRFVYDPMSFKLGALISILSLLCLAIYIIRKSLRLTR